MKLYLSGGVVAMRRMLSHLSWLSVGFAVSRLSRSTRGLIPLVTRHVHVARPPSKQSVQQSARGISIVHGARPAAEVCSAAVSKEFVHKQILDETKGSVVVLWSRG